MEHEKVINILQGTDSEAVKNLVNKLNFDGIVSDEDGCIVSSFMIEHWSEECDLYLYRNGYTGSRLVRYGKFFPSHGAVYVLFDGDRHSLETANKYMNYHVESYER